MRSPATSSPDAPASPAPDKKLATLVWTAAGRGLRLGLILLVVWLSLSTARSIYQLLHSTTTTARPDVATAAAPPPADLLRQLPAEGYWTFHDFPWRLARTEVLPATLQLVEPAEQPGTLSPSTPQEQAFLASLKNLTDRGTSLPSGATVFRLPGQFPIQITTREIHGTPRLLSATIELPDSRTPASGSRTLLQLLPQNAEGEGPTQVAHLLPVPAGSLRTFARWTNADELLLEFVETPRTLSALLLDWRAADWETRLVPGVTGVGSSYLCVNGERLIIVYVQQAGEQSTSLLLASPGKSKR